MVLRHLVSEINRWAFRWWAPAQILLGGLVLAETARRLGLLHASYVGADLAKALLLSGAAWILARRGLA